MNSRVHQNDKTKSQITNWADYDQTLVNPGVLQSRKPKHLIIDSSGLSIVGKGEWAGAKHGGGGKGGWRKLHHAVDADGRVHTQVLTKSHVDDVTTGIKISEAT